MIGYIYKLCCDGINEFYIGSSFDMKTRKQSHKYNCNNPSRKKNHYKVYKYIRANGGFDKWKFDILEENEFENEEVLHSREQHYLNLLKPTLNCQGAYQTDEERKQYQKIYDRNRKLNKFICVCGRETNNGNKYNHEKLKHHQKYLQTINNITNHIQHLNINITINKK